VLFKDAAFLSYIFHLGKYSWDSAVSSIVLISVITETNLVEELCRREMQGDVQQVAYGSSSVIKFHLPLCVVSGFDDMENSPHLLDLLRKPRERYDKILPGPKLTPRISRKFEAFR